jgi:hypothetical protein
MSAFAYRLANASTMDAAEDPRIAPVLCGGPYAYSLAGDLVIATLPGQPRTPEAYGPAVGLGDGLSFLPPAGPCTIHDLAREKVSGDGVTVRLACGLDVSIPVALIRHRQLILSGPKPRLGDPVTEYGKTAARLYEQASGQDGLQQDNPDLGRLLILALAQHYHVTAHMIDHLACLSADDIDPILGAAWAGDPKALAPASDDAPRASQPSVSTGAT